MGTAVRRSSLAALVGCLAVALTACGGDPQTEAGVEDTVEEYLEAFSQGDGDDACDLMTEDYAEEFVDEWNESGFGGDEESEDCEDVVEASLVVAEAFGVSDFGIAEISTDLDGDRATADVEYEDDDSDGEVYELVYEDGDWLIDGQAEVDEDEVDDEESEESEESESEPTEETTTPAALPSAIGDVGVVGDWEVRVTEVDDDATELLTKPRYYNSRPDGTYVLVTFEATYLGSDRSSDIQFDLSWSLTTSDQQVHEEADPTTPAEHDSWPTEARSGGTVSGQAVFDIDPAQLAGALVTVEAYGDEGVEEYVDFAL